MTAIEGGATSTGDFVMFVVGLVVAFGVLPLLVLPRPRGVRSGLDAYVVNLVRWLAIIIVASHAFSAVGIYGLWIWLPFIALVAWFGRYRYQFDSPKPWLRWVFPSGGDGRRRIPKLKVGVADRLRLLVIALPTLAVFIGSFWLRAISIFSSEELHPPDAYVHLAWAQSFVNNQLWPDGFYPQGLPAIVAFTNVFTPFVDIFDVARFMGPLVGTTIVAAIYYVVVRLTRQPGAALFAAGSVGLFGALPQWRISWSLQAGLLPQEFGLAIALVAMVFAVLAVSESTADGTVRMFPFRSITVSGYALWAGLATFVVSMTHPISLLALAVVTATAAICATAISFRFRRLVVTGVTVLVGAVIGQLVQPVAYLFGVQRYQEWENAGGLAGVLLQSDRSDAWGDLSMLGRNELSFLAGAATVVALIGAGLVYKRGSRVRASQLLGLTCAGGVMVVLHDLTLIMFTVSDLYLDRFAGIIGQSLPLALGAGFASLSLIAARTVTLTKVAVLMVAGVVALGGFAWFAQSIASDGDIHFSRDFSATVYEEIAR
ncbi:MAG: hypothetical protein WD532_00230 [Acidimicrobiia bacterium]